MKFHSQIELAHAIPEELRGLSLEAGGILIAPPPSEDDLVATPTELIPNNEPCRKPMRSALREKWFALIAFVVVTVSAVALLLPR